jgi:hypothetical protein
MLPARAEWPPGRLRPAEQPDDQRHDVADGQRAKRRAGTEHDLAPPPGQINENGTDRTNRMNGIFHNSAAPHRGRAA